MWTRRTGKSLSDRAGTRAFLEGGAGTRSQKQEQVAGTEQGAGPEEMPGSRREAPPEDTAHRKAGSAENHRHPPLGRGSSALAWGLRLGICSLNVGGDDEPWDANREAGARRGSCGPGSASSTLLWSWGPAWGPCLGVGVGSKQSSRTEAFPGTKGVLMRETRKRKGPPGGRAAWPWASQSSIGFRLLCATHCSPRVQGEAVRGDRGVVK